MTTEATERFRARLAIELAPFLQPGVTIVDVGTDDGPPAVVWVTLEAGSKRWSLAGEVETVLSAWNGLLRRASEDRLAGAFHEVVGSS
jgi:hypothetical protein